MPTSTPNLKIAKQPSLRHIVYEKLKDAILAEAIPKGIRIYESKLAEEMGISRTPVREALHSLEREMLISSIDKVGYVVNDIDREDLEEISEIRKTVEALALKKTIKQMGEKDFRKLEKNMARSETVLKHHKTDSFLLLDAEFHKILCSMSGRSRLIRMAETLRKEMQRFRNRSKSLHPLAMVSLEYHKKIVYFLKKKDYKNVKKILDEHIDHVKNNISKEAQYGQQVRFLR
jgi:DNA-binding GntR family transcriptional regulator